MLEILTQSYWRDEAFSLILSQKDFFSILKLTAQDASPFLYYFILHIWISFFGITETPVRILSLLFHILSSTAVFFITKKIANSKSISLITALIFLLNPFLLQYSFEARAYSLFVLLTLLSILSYIYEKRIITSCLLGLLVLTHNFGIFTIASFTIFDIFFLEKKSIKTTFQLLIFPIIALVFWGGVFLTQWKMVAKEFWIPPLSQERLILTMKNFLTGDLGYPFQPFIFNYSRYLLYISFIVFPFILIVRKQKNLFLLFLVMVMPFLSTIILEYLGISLFLDRYLIISLACFLIAASISLYEFAKKYQFLKLILILGSIVYITFLIKGDNEIIHTITKAPVKQAVLEIEKNKQGIDGIIPEDKVDYLEVVYYTNQGGNDLPVWVIVPDGKIPFYIGGVLYPKEVILKELPPHKVFWQVGKDASLKKIET